MVAMMELRFQLQQHSHLPLLHLLRPQGLQLLHQQLWLQLKLPKPIPLPAQLRLQVQQHSHPPLLHLLRPQGLQLSHQQHWPQLKLPKPLPTQPPTTAAPTETTRAPTVTSTTLAPTETTKTHTMNEWRNSGGMLQQQGRETLKSSQGPCAPAGWQASKHSDPLHPTVKTCFHTIIAAQQIFYCLRRKIEPPDFEVGLNLNYSHVYIVVGEVACN